MSDQKQIEELKKYLASAEADLAAAKKALAELTGYEPSTPSVPLDLKVTADGKVIEGIFNGENMLGPEGKVFPVPANYASKSKLIEGDKLKLSVAEDGSFIFKQIGPAPRKKIVGDLVFEDNMFQVKAEGKSYHLLYAAATFFKAKPGDKVTIIIPDGVEATWAALENIIHDVAPKAEAAPENDVINLDLPNQNQTAAKVEDFFGQPTTQTQPEPSVPTPTSDVTVPEVNGSTEPTDSPLATTNEINDLEI